MSNSLIHGELTGKIIKAFYDVYNQLGYGFLENVYENALVHELRKRGHSVTQQAPISVRYDTIIVGEYFADMLVDGTVIIELKRADRINKAHVAQLLNYLKATDMEVGLVLNFGPKPEFRRKVFTQAKKNQRRSAKSALSALS